MRDKRYIDGGLALSESLSLKAVSLILSLILWISVVGFKAEETKKTIRFDPSLPPNKVLLNKIPNHIQVTFLGSRVLLNDVEKRLRPINPDLSKIKDNFFNFNLTEELLGDLPQEVKVVSIYPPIIPMRFDQVIEGKLPVILNLQGKLADKTELYRTSVMPSQITVLAPRSFLEQMDGIRTEPILLDDVAESKEIIVSLESDNGMGIQFPKEKVVTVRLTLRKKK